MADCCLTGSTREETLINHVRWLSSWAVVMTKKVEALDDIINAMTEVETPDARRAIAVGASRMLTFVEQPGDRSDDDIYGLKILMEQFKRAGDMVKCPENIPFTKREEKTTASAEEPKVQEKNQIELGAMAQCLRFCMVAGSPVPDIEFGGFGTADDLVKVQDIVCDSVLKKKAYSVDEISSALKEAGYDGCQVALTTVGSDMKCGLTIRIPKNETVPTSTEEQPTP